MTDFQIPQPGDVYSFEESERSVVISQEAINALGAVMTLPIGFSDITGPARKFTVPVIGKTTIGLVHCNQIRSYDIENLVKTGQAHYVETLERTLTVELIQRVVKIIDGDFCKRPSLPQD